MESNPWFRRNTTKAWAEQQTLFAQTANGQTFSSDEKKPPRTTFAAYLQRLARLGDYGEQLVEKRILYPIRLESEIRFVGHWGKFDNPHYQTVLRDVLKSADYQLAIAADLYCGAQIFANGPKVFCPTYDECKAFEEIEVRIPAAAYAQPFPTMITRLDERYTAEALVFGKGLDHDGVPREIGYRPIAQIVHWEQSLNALFTVTVTDTPSMLALIGIIGQEGAKTIEEDLQKKLLGGAESNSDEIAVEQRCNRIALNSMLMLMDRGFRRLPADNPSHKARLERRVDKGPPQHRAANQRELRMIPDVFAFAQVTDVRRAVGSAEAAEGTPTGRHVKTHWRSAHWAMQPYGPGQSLRKRILRPHVLVNKADVSPSDTVVVLK